MGNDLESGLSPSEIRDLQRIAGIMLPADTSYGVPAASDAIIFADILNSIGRDRADITIALAALGGETFSQLDDTAARTAVITFLSARSRPAVVLGRVILQCYYRDDRVLRSLGHEPRAPFPRGHVLEQGDWSLLDAVKHRPRLWRDDRVA